MYILFQNRICEQYKLNICPINKLHSKHFLYKCNVSYYNLSRKENSYVISWNVIRNIFNLVPFALYKQDKWNFVQFIQRKKYFLKGKTFAYWIFFFFEELYQPIVYTKLSSLKTIRKLLNIFLYAVFSFTEFVIVFFNYMMKHWIIYKLKTAITSRLIEIIKKLVS